MEAATRRLAKKAIDIKAANVVRANLHSGAQKFVTTSLNSISVLSVRFEMPQMQQLS